MPSRKAMRAAVSLPSSRPGRASRPWERPPVVAGGATEQAGELALDQLGGSQPGPRILDQPFARRADRSTCAERKRPGIVSSHEPPWFNPGYGGPFQPPPWAKAVPRERRWHEERGRRIGTCQGCFVFHTGQAERSQVAVVSSIQPGRHRTKAALIAPASKRIPSGKQKAASSPQVVVVWTRWKRHPR
jgi:hypothetical protein